jgi:biotin carboxyl carrier protein
VFDGFRPNLSEALHQWVSLDGQSQILRGRLSSSQESWRCRVEGDEEDSRVYWLDETFHCAGAFGHWQLSASERDDEVWLFLRNSTQVETAKITYQRVHPGAGRHRQSAGAGDLTAPMTGRVVQVSVSVGDAVDAGDVLVVLEAMKMEHAVRSGAAGQVTEVHCAPGDLVQGGVVLVEVEAEGDD